MITTTIHKNMHVQLLDTTHQLREPSIFEARVAKEKQEELLVKLVKQY